MNYKLMVFPFFFSSMTVWCCTQPKTDLPVTEKMIQAIAARNGYQILLNSAEERVKEAKKERDMLFANKIAPGGTIIKNPCTNNQSESEQRVDNKDKDWFMDAMTSITDKETATEAERRIAVLKSVGVFNDAPKAKL